MLTSLLVLKMPLSTVHTFVVVIFTFASFAKSGITSKEYAIKADSKSDVIDLCRHTGCTFIRQVRITNEKIKYSLKNIIHNIKKV